MATLKIIPYNAIEKALAQENDTLNEQRECNTTYHTREEAEAVLPYMGHHASKGYPEEQHWILLRPWRDVIMTSQGLLEIDVHRIQLPDSLLTRLISASKASQYLGQVSEGDADDLADEFPRSTVRGGSVEDLIQSSKFFTRSILAVNDVIIGQGPIRDRRDPWMRLATSARGITGIRDVRKYVPSMSVYMYLFLWEDDMKTELEYHVYCAPPTVKIAAISRYKWHSPWYHVSAARFKQERIAQELLESCPNLHQRIMAHAAITEKLKSRGFFNDVAEDPSTQDVQLIKLNEFGAMSGCGACLCHWIRDARVIYGLGEAVEVCVPA